MKLEKQVDEIYHTSNHIKYVEDVPGKDLSKSEREWNEKCSVDEICRGGDDAPDDGNARERIYNGETKNG